MNRVRKQLRAERIARAIGLGRTKAYGWRRRNPYENRGTATFDALRAAEAKRARRRVRNLDLRVRQACGGPSNARRRFYVEPPGARYGFARWYRPAWKRAR